MTPSETPTFYFQQSGKNIWVRFNNHPIRNSDGTQKKFDFHMEAGSGLEAVLLKEYFDKFSHLIRKHYFTEGFNTHKKRMPNYYAD